MPEKTRRRKKFMGCVVGILFLVFLVLLASRVFVLDPRVPTAPKPTIAAVAAATSVPDSMEAVLDPGALFGPNEWFAVFFDTEGALISLEEIEVVVTVASGSAGSASGTYTRLANRKVPFTQICELAQEQGLRAEPLGRKYTTNFPSEFTEVELVEALYQHAKAGWNSPVTREDWTYLVAQAQGCNVNPLWLGAISVNESHMCGYSNRYTMGNCWGVDMSGTDAGATSFNEGNRSPAEAFKVGINYIVPWIAYHYWMPYNPYGKPLLTFEEFEKEYASHINPPNGAWAQAIRGFYDDIYARLPAR